ncbi:MAG: response regulator transcription factor [Planctomycetota bacterium]
MVLLEQHFDRELVVRVGAADGRFDVIAPAGVPEAVESLAGRSSIVDALLLDEPLLQEAQATLLQDWQPVHTVVLGRSRTPDNVAEIELGSVKFLSRESSWDEVASQLAPTIQASPLGKPMAAVACATQNGSCRDHDRYAELTPREQQVLELIAGGASVRDCAHTLEIAESTVDNHKSRLMKKLGVRKSVELVRFAFRIGITS